MQVLSSQFQVNSSSWPSNKTAYHQTTFSPILYCITASITSLRAWEFFLTSVSITRYALRRASQLLARSASPSTRKLEHLSSNPYYGSQYPRHAHILGPSPHVGIRQEVSPHKATKHAMMPSQHVSWRDFSPLLRTRVLGEVGIIRSLRKEGLATMKS